jgi:hypothetical protein
MTVRSGLQEAPPLLELRQYLPRSGRRAELIELFDREFVESQEAEGMRVVGQFRDVDRPNHFVWMRGFAGPERRAASLAAFYGGKTWRRHGPAASATMLDFDDVLQLRVHQGHDRPLQLLPPARREAVGEPGVVLLVVVHRRRGQEPTHDEMTLPLLDRLAVETGLRPRGIYETDGTPNGYPALPLRPANCAVWIASGTDLDLLDRAAEALVAVRRELARATERRGLDEVQLDVRRLVPTPRSTLVHVKPSQQL